MTGAPVGGPPQSRTRIQLERPRRSSLTPPEHRCNVEAMARATGGRGGLLGAARESYRGRDWVVARERFRAAAFREGDGTSLAVAGAVALALDTADDRVENVTFGVGAGVVCAALVWLGYALGRAGRRARPRTG